MDELKIFWTRTALQQRSIIFDYWNERNKSKSYSRKLNIAIGQRLNLLKTQPNLGKSTHFKNTRAISLKHYSILYQVGPSKIIVAAIWDNRQDPQRLLKFLKHE